MNQPCYASKPAQPLVLLPKEPHLPIPSLIYSWGLSLHAFPWLWCFHSDPAVFLKAITHCWFPGPASQGAASITPLAAGGSSHRCAGQLYQAGATLGMLQVHQVSTICEAKEQKETFNAGAAARSLGSTRAWPGRNGDPDSSCIFNDAAQQRTHLIAEGTKASLGAGVLEAFLHPSGQISFLQLMKVPPLVLAGLDSGPEQPREGKATARTYSCEDQGLGCGDLNTDVLSSVRRVALPVGCPDGNVTVQTQGLCSSTRITRVMLSVVSVWPVTHIQCVQ